MEYFVHTKHVHEGDIPLPRIKGGGKVVVDLRGDDLVLGPNSNGFTTPTGSAPLTDTSTSYHIRNGRIIGGKKAIHLSATFGSTVENVELRGQTEIALHCEFALMSTLKGVMVTNPLGHGIYLGTGGFDGWGTNLNSQCNASTLENCRVYNDGRMVGNSYTIMHSNGIQMRNCISEGHSNDGWCLYYDGWNSTVKNFLLDGFHVEHSKNPKKGGIFIQAQSNTANQLRQLFIQGWTSESPAVYLSRNSAVVFEQIGWWTDRMNIELSHRAPRIKSRDCYPALNVKRIKFNGQFDPQNLHFNV